MTMLTSGMTSSASAEWGTPDSLFQPAHALYDFTLDGAASHLNAKLPRYCTADGTWDRNGQRWCTCPADPGGLIGPRRTPHDPNCPSTMPSLPDGTRQISPLDGLNFPWRDERVFLNPPWGDGLPDFVRKARNETLRNRALVYAILPARTDTAWFHDYVLPYARLQWVRGRPKFIDPEADSRKEAGAPPRNSPPVGIVKALFR